MKRLAVATLAVALTFSAACWSDPASTVGRAHLVVAFMPLGNGGGFTARINGQTFSTAGQFAVELASLDPTYEVSGTFDSPGFRIEFHTSTTAGVEAQSVVNVSGPVVQIERCAVAYVAEGSGSQSFRAQFRLSGTIDRVCR